MENLDSIYFAARELPPEDRPAYLTKACEGDQALRTRVEQMLAVSAEAEAFVTDLPDDEAAERKPGRETDKTLKVNLDDAPEEIIGQKIGRYKILERVGEGGCGVVYVAEQTEPVRRRVALKVIKLGMDTKQVVARFEAERQALAMMDHPNIAKVLDGGTTEQGRPFFVMELVRGIRITDYCDQANVPTKERLDLFLKVCQAIQHAHQKGIIHRDIKPSNILVTLNDGVPVPKVIDFGIAKATEGRLTDATVYTQLHQFVGTPAYMSPEQAEMSSLDIDTRSDIYSLGVLLYELLVGSTPFDAKELVASGIDAMRKTIREKEPVRPSTKLATLKGDELTTTAKRRSAEAPKLIHLLKGDLDWIVMKCLEKDRTHRYETANGLAADLQRHLSNEPVVARPPGTVYRLQKLMRRNKLAFAAGTGIAASLVIGIAVSLWQVVRATHAEKKTAAERDAKELARQDAEAISKFLTEVFQSPDPARDGRTITVAETLDKAAKKLDTDLASQPDRRAKLQATLGSTYFALGLYREAIPLQEKVRDYHLATSGLEHSDTLEAMHNLAISYFNAGRRDEALKLREEVLALSRKVLGPEHPGTLVAMNQLAGSYGSYFDASRRGELKLSEEALALSRKALGPEHPDTLAAMQNLANSYARAGRRDEALKLQEEVLPLSRKVSGPEHAETLTAMNQLANSYFDTGRLDEALKLREEVLALRRKESGPEHPHTLMAMGNLAISYFDTGRRDEALKLLEEVLTLRRKVLGPEHPDALAAMHNLAHYYFDTGRRDEALKLREEVVTLSRKVLGPEHPDTFTAMSNLAISDADAGRRDEALKMHEDALALSLKLDPKSQGTAEAYAQLGFTLDAVGRGDDAIKAWQEAVRISPVGTPNTHYWLGKALMDRQRYAEALPILRATQKFYPDGERGWETADRIALAEAGLGGENTETGRPNLAHADASMKKWLTALRATVAANPSDTDKAKQLATVHLWLGETNEHQTLCRNLLELAANSKDPTAHDRAAKAYLIQPRPDPDTLRQAVASGRQALKLAGAKDANRGWFLITAAMAEVRDGRLAEAEILLNETLTLPDNSKERRSLALAYRTLARAQLNRLSEARADLAELEALLPNFPAPPTALAIFYSADSLAVLLAREEARALLNPPLAPQP